MTRVDADKLANVFIQTVRHIENGVDLVKTKPGCLADIFNSERNRLLETTLQRDRDTTPINHVDNDLFFKTFQINALTMAACIAAAKENNYEIVVSVSARPDDTTPWSNYYVRIPDREVSGAEETNPRSNQ